MDGWKTQKKQSPFWYVAMWSFTCFTPLCPGIKRWIPIPHRFPLVPQAGTNNGIKEVGMCWTGYYHLATSSHSCKVSK